MVGISCRPAEAARDTRTERLALTDGTRVSLAHVASTRQVTAKALIATLRSLGRLRGVRVSGMMTYVIQGS